MKYVNDSVMEDVMPKINIFVFVTVDLYFSNTNHIILKCDTNHLSLLAMVWW